jgi:hypothetical protein
VSLVIARLGAFACVFAAATCFAQTPEEVRREAKMHWGVFYITPRFAVEEFGVDTNVFRNADAKRDFTFTVAPAAAASVPFGRRAVVTTNIGSDVVYYQQFTSERSINPDVNVRSTAFLGRVEPFAEFGYLRSRQRANQEIDTRSLRRELTSTAGAVVRLGGRSSVELSGQSWQVKYDASETFNDVFLQETLNRSAQRFAVEGRYDATPLTTFILRTESVADRFAVSPLRNADSLAIVPGVMFKPRALVSGSAHVGFRRFKPSSVSLQPFSGAVVNATLSYTLQGMTRFTVAATRDLTYSYERVQPYFVVDGLSVAVRRKVVGAIDVSGSVQRYRYGYRDLLLPGGVSADLSRVDTLRGWSAGLGYRIGNAMRAGVAVTFQERTSSSERLRDYQGNRFITSLDYEL